MINYSSMLGHNVTVSSSDDGKVVTNNILYIHAAAAAGHAT